MDKGLKPTVEGEVCKGFLEVLYCAVFKGSEELGKVVCSDPVGVVWLEEIGGK